MSTKLAVNTKMFLYFWIDKNYIYKGEFWNRFAKAAEGPKHFSLRFPHHAERPLVEKIISECKRN